MNDNSREAVIAKYTNKSRYKPEYIFGNVYVDEERIAETLKSKDEKEIFEKELKIAKRFSERYGLEIFMLPQMEGNKIIYLEKHSNPDIITNGIFADIKCPSGSEISIKKRFQESVHQADGVIISINKPLSILKIKKWIEDKMRWMDNHDGFIVAIEVGSMNKKYDIFEIKEKGLEKAPLIGCRGFRPRSIK